MDALHAQYDMPSSSIQLAICIQNMKTRTGPDQKYIEQTD